MQSSRSAASVLRMEFPAWDPVLLSIPGLPIAIRWYGLMYVVGFVIGQHLLVRLARSGFFPVDPKVAPDLVFYCVIGVMLGGRTGYALFYDQSLLWPWEFIKVWRGGLAFHGGLAGVAVAAWLFARRNGVRWAQVADACVLAGTPGIFAVRMANFINGELYGRITDRSTFGAMQFPTDPMALRLLGLSDGLSMRDRELAIQVAYGKRTLAEVRDQLSSVDADGAPIPWDAIAPRLDWSKVSQLADPAGNPLVPFRHPSQIYEGIAEGLLLGLILWGMYLVLRGRERRPGLFLVVFLVGYAVLRGLLENVRQPDAQFGPTGEVLFGMTMGQTLSAAMVVGAVLVVVFSRRRGRS